MRKRLAVAVSLLLLLVLCGCPQNGTATLAQVIPNSIPVGAGNTSLELVGSNFTTGAIAFWTDTSRHQLATTFLDSSHLTAIVPANLLEVAGVASVFAAQAGQNQSQTQSLTITISNIAPTLTGMAPMHILTTAQAFTLTLTGTNFNSSSVVMWGATPLATTLVSSTQLTAAVPTTAFASAQTVSVTVVNGGTGGGTSAALSFTVVAPLAITTTTLPGGSLGTPYTATVLAVGGVKPYSWSIATGSLPTGLSLNGATGVISGTPTAAGSATFTIQVVDSTGSLARLVIKTKKTE